MKPVDHAIRAWIEPVLTEAGFTRKGRKFLVEGADGSRGEVAVGTFGQGFYVDLFISPRVWSEFNIRTRGVADSDLWHERLRGTGDGTAWGSEWAFDVVEQDRGVRLQNALREQVYEQLRLLDQAALLEYSLRPIRESMGVTVRRELAVPVLLAAQGPSAALDERLAALGSDPQWREADERFVSFIREWLAENYK